MVLNTGCPWGSTVNKSLLKAFKQGWQNFSILFFNDEDMIYIDILVLLFFSWSHIFPLLFQFFLREIGEFSS